MKILVDMNLSPGWVAALSGAGHEAVHWRTVGDRRATDPEIIAYAQEHGFVVLTQDLDFGDLLAAGGGQGPSVVQIRAADLRVEVLKDQVLAGLRAASEALARGALVSIDIRRARVRMLPLRPAG